MSSLLCASGNQEEFGGEILIHFRGLKNLDKPSVWVFPKLVVCLDCGSSRFMIPESELALLATGAPSSERSIHDPLALGGVRFALLSGRVGRRSPMCLQTAFPG